MSIKLLTWLSTYIIIFLCELGDKTQLAVLLFTSNNPRQKWNIFLASSLALVLCVMIEVTLGVSLARYIGPNLVNRIAGGVFLLLGMIIFFKSLNIKEKLIKIINVKIMAKVRKSPEHMENIPVTLQIKANEDY